MLLPVAMHSDGSRTWRNAKQAAVRQYGAGTAADRAAALAVKRYIKWQAKRARATTVARVVALHAAPRSGAR